MKAIDQAKRIYRICVERANAKRTVTYGEILNLLGYKNGVPGHAIRYGLELVLIACGDRGLPALTCIVVNDATGKPAEGGHPKATWEKDVQATFNQKEWPDMDDTDWSHVWKNRKMLSSRYGTLGYFGK